MTAAIKGKKDIFVDEKLLNDNKSLESYITLQRL